MRLTLDIFIRIAEFARQPNNASSLLQHIEGQATVLNLIKTSRVSLPLLCCSLNTVRYSGTTSHRLSFPYLGINLPLTLSSSSTMHALLPSTATAL